MISEAEGRRSRATARVKSRVEDFAVFGGTPAFTSVVHVGRPNIGRRDRLFERLDDMLDRRYLTNDVYVAQLEATLAERLSVRHAVAVANGTLGLALTLRAAGVSGLVIVPSFTFVATAHVLVWMGITPVFCDVDPVTHNLVPERVEALITPRVSGIVGVHLWGRACPVEALDDIARPRGLILLYDAAHAFGCSHRGRMIGGFGRAEILSFNATKFVNSFEGGAILTNDDDLAQNLRRIRNFGFVDYDSVAALGINAKMSEASAAMGLTSLESADEFIAVNRRHYLTYQRGLSSVPGVTLVEYSKTEQQNYQYVVIEVDQERAGLSRDQLQRLLWRENILVRRYFYPGCHRMEPYRSMKRYRNLTLPNTEWLASRVLCLPTGTAVRDEDVEAICRVVTSAIQLAPKIAAKFATTM